MDTASSRGDEFDFAYSVYGLTLGSEFPLRGLRASKPPVDLAVSEGTVDPPVPESTDHNGIVLVESDTVWFEYPRQASFLVRNGREIIVDSTPSLDTETRQRILLGPVLGAILHQRGDLPLHASAVVVDGVTAAFLGGSGAGKSTLATALLSCGHAVVCDDITAVSIRDGTPIVQAGFPLIKVEPALASRADMSAPVGDSTNTTEFDRHYYPVERTVSEPAVSLDHIYVLTDKNHVGITPIRSNNAMMALIRHTYLPQVIADTDPTGHFQDCADLVETITISRLGRGADLESLPEITKLVEADLRDHQ